MLTVFIIMQVCLFSEVFIQILLNLNLTLTLNLNLFYYSNKFDFVISEFVSPICLPAKSEVGETFVGETMTVSGWGRESDSSSGIARVKSWSIFLLFNKNLEFIKRSYLMNPESIRYLQMDFNLIRKNMSYT